VATPLACEFLDEPDVVVQNADEVEDEVEAEQDHGSTCNLSEKPGAAAADEVHPPGENDAEDRKGEREPGGEHQARPQKFGLLFPASELFHGEPGQDGKICREQRQHAGGDEGDEPCGQGCEDVWLIHFCASSFIIFTNSGLS
jgi:hypothetical protein